MPWNEKLSDCVKPCKTERVYPNSFVGDVDHSSLSIALNMNTATVNVNG